MVDNKKNENSKGRPLGPPPVSFENLLNTIEKITFRSCGILHLFDFHFGRRRSQDVPRFSTKFSKLFQDLAVRCFAHLLSRNDLKLDID